ncbi:MAG: hypothetical protein IJ810_01855 [Candidatus Methanomethylophilus sp.]|nr:hypothetical protein [Methanomethylophilus sp.]
MSKTRTKVTQEMRDELQERVLRHEKVEDIAKKIGVSRRTGYRILKELIDEGKIQNIGYTSPGFFVSAEDDKAQSTGGGAYGTAPLEHTLSEAHLSGSFYTAVLRQGDMEDIRDARGFCYGYWSKDVKHPTGSDEYSADIRIFDTPVILRYRRGNRGSMSIRMNIGRIALDPLQYDSSEQVIEVFVQRAKAVFDILELHDWSFSEEFKLKGNIHFAWPNHPWGEFLDRVYKMADEQIVADHSNGKLEVEIENGETPDGLSNAQILSHAGAHIEALHQQETDNELSIYSLQALARENAMLFQQLLENQKLIGQIFIEQQTPKTAIPYDPVKGKLEGYQ